MQGSRLVSATLWNQPNPGHSTLFDTASESGDCIELPYDVISEMWFDNEQNYKGTLDYITTTVMPDEVVQDEMNFFDRPTMRIATVIERETTMSPEGTPVL